MGIWFLSVYPVDFKQLCPLPCTHVTLSPMFFKVFIASGIFSYIQYLHTKYIKKSMKINLLVFFQEVARFLDAKHKDSYLVFDLCSKYALFLATSNKQMSRFRMLYRKIISKHCKLNYFTNISD